MNPTQQPQQPFYNQAHLPPSSGPQGVPPNHGPQPENSTHVDQAGPGSQIPQQLPFAILPLGVALGVPLGIPLGVPLLGAPPSRNPQDVPNSSGPQGVTPSRGPQPETSTHVDQAGPASQIPQPLPFATLPLVAPLGVLLGVPLLGVPPSSNPQGVPTSSGPQGVPPNHGPQPETSTHADQAGPGSQIPQPLPFATLPLVAPLGVLLGVPLGIPQGVPASIGTQGVSPSSGPQPETSTHVDQAGAGSQMVMIAQQLPFVILQLGPTYFMPGQEQVVVPQEPEPAAAPEPQCPAASPPAPEEAELTKEDKEDKLDTENIQPESPQTSTTVDPEETKKYDSEILLSLPAISDVILDKEQVVVPPEPEPTPALEPQCPAASPPAPEEAELTKEDKEDKLDTENIQPESPQTSTTVDPEETMKYDGEILLSLPAICDIILDKEQVVVPQEPEPAAAPEPQCPAASPPAPEEAELTKEDKEDKLDTENIQPESPQTSTTVDPEETKKYDSEILLSLPAISDVILDKEQVVVPPEPEPTPALEPQCPAASPPAPEEAELTKEDKLDTENIQPESPQTSTTVDPEETMKYDGEILLSLPAICDIILDKEQVVVPPEPEPAAAPEPQCPAASPPAPEEAELTKEDKEDKLDTENIQPESPQTSTTVDPEETMKYDGEILLSLPAICDVILDKEQVVVPQEPEPAAAPEPQCPAASPPAPEEAELTKEDKEDKEDKLDAENIQPESPQTSTIDKKFQFKEVMQETLSTPPPPPPPTPTPTKPALSEEALVKKSKAIIDEYLHLNDMKEALQCVQEMNSTELLFVFVRDGLELTLERRAVARERMGLLLHQLLKTGILPTEQYYKGLQVILEVAEDMAIDIPHFWLYLAEQTTPMLQEGGIPMGDLFREISKPLIPLGKAGVLLAHILNVLCKGMSHEKAGTMWREAGLQWKDFLPEDVDVSAFVKEQKVEFTLCDESEKSPAKELSAAELREELETLLQDKTDNLKIIDWVEEQVVVPPESEPEPAPAPEPQCPAASPAAPEEAELTKEDKEDKEDKLDAVNIQPESPQTSTTVDPEETKKYNSEILLSLPAIGDVILDKEQVVVPPEPEPTPAPEPQCPAASPPAPEEAELTKEDKEDKLDTENIQPDVPQRRKIIMSLSLNNDIELNKAEKAWKPSNVKGITHNHVATAVVVDIDPENLKTQEMFRQVRSILNKLTPQMFQNLMKRMTALTIDTEERLNGVIDLIFEKAISEPSFSETYANMCHGLTGLKVKAADKSGANVNFRKLLLNRCQKEFQEDKDDIEIIEKKQKELEAASGDEEKQLLRKALTDTKDKARRRSLGNMKFIGELFKVQMLTEGIMHDCVVKLLKNHDEESLECLCRLLSTVGKDLDIKKANPRMDQYFHHMEKIIKEKKTSSRIFFMLQDVLELRQNNWVPRRADQGPKTIDQIHKEAELEDHREQMMVQQAFMSNMENGRGPGWMGQGGPGGCRGPYNQDRGYSSQDEGPLRPGGRRGPYNQDRGYSTQDEGPLRPGGRRDPYNQDRSYSSQDEGPLRPGGRRGPYNQDRGYSTQDEGPLRPGGRRGPYNQDRGYSSQDEGPLRPGGRRGPYNQDRSYSTQDEGPLRPGGRRDTYNQDRGYSTQDEGPLRPGGRRDTYNQDRGYSTQDEGPLRPGGRREPYNQDRGYSTQDEGWNRVPISRNRPINADRPSKTTKAPHLDSNNQLLVSGGKVSDSGSRQATSNQNRFSALQQSPTSQSSWMHSDRTVPQRNSWNQHCDRVERDERRVGWDGNRLQVTNSNFSRRNAERNREREERGADNPTHRVARMTDDRGRGERARSKENVKRETPSTPSTPPPPPTPTPTPTPTNPTPTPTKPALSEEALVKKSKAIIDEYLHLNDMKEALQCVQELNSTELLFVFVRDGLELTLERRAIARERMGLLLHQLLKTGILPTEQYYKGLQVILEVAEDMAIDIPQFWLYLAEQTTPMLQEGGIPMGDLFREISKPLIPLGKAGVLLAHILNVLCKGMSHEKAGTMWREAGLQWKDFLPEDVDVSTFVKEQKVEFTLCDESEKSPAKELSAAELREELEKLLQDKTDNLKIIDWVEANLHEQQTSNMFVRVLMTCVCQAAITCKKPYKLDISMMVRRAGLLRRYLQDEQKELQALFALQALMVELKSRANLLRILFHCLYDEDVVTEEAFFKWEATKDAAENKGKVVALKSVATFFIRLRKSKNSR